MTKGRWLFVAVFLVSFIVGVEVLSRFRGPRPAGEAVAPAPELVAILVTVTPTPAPFLHVKAAGVCRACGDKGEDIYIPIEVDGQGHVVTAGGKK